MRDLQPDIDRPRRYARRAFLRGVVLLCGSAAVLAACTSSPPAAPTTSLPPVASASPADPPKPTGAPAASPPPSPSLSPSPQASPAAGGIAPAPAAANRPPGTPKPGGTLVVARTSEPASLDPQLAPSLSRQRVTMLTYNNLIRLGPDLAIQPDLAESWRVSADGKQIDFTLRQGVLWHPPVGRELTADDVKFSYDRLLRDSPGKADFASIDEVEVLDKYHVRFALTAANAGLLATMADSRWGAIVNRETIEQHGSLNAVAVGTGPFIYVGRSERQESTYRRNPDYFEKGKPYLETLVIRTLADEAAIVDGLRRGTLHHAMLEENRSVEPLKDQAGLTIQRMPRLGYDFLSFNQRRAPFDKAEVIQAINYAVDREECIKSAAFGYAALTAPCTPPMKQWQLPESEWRPRYQIDLDRARQLLARAGYPNGFEATVLTIPTIPTMFANAQVAQANLKRVGITLKVESVEYALWVQRWQRKEFEATLNTTGGFADPDTAFYRAFHSKSQNWNNLRNPDLDKLLDDGRAIYEVEKRKPIYDKVQRLLLEQPGHLYLFSSEMIDVTQKSVQGFTQHPTTTLWSYQNTWLDT